MSMKITPPVAEPITLAEAKLHLRLDDDGDSPPVHPDDPLIQMLISAAREWCEGYLGRAAAPQMIELALDSFPSSYLTGSAYFGSGCLRSLYNAVVTTSAGAIMLPMPPLSSIISIKYIDENIVEQTLASSAYAVDDFQQPSWLLPASGTSWPATAAVINAVKIRYWAGYDLPGDSPNPNPLPWSIVAAMKLVLGHLYENRENSAQFSGNLELIPMGAQALLDGYRIRLGLA